MNEAVNKGITQGSVSGPYLFNSLTAVLALGALIDFTLSNARRFYLSMGNPLTVKGYFS